MNWMRILVSLGLLLLLWASWDKWGWPGVMMVSGALVMWVLLNVNRMLTVMRRAANRPKGMVLSAVMFNAKLKPKVTLLHVTAITASLGEPLSDEGVQPEVYRWTDAGGSHVTCTFQDGRLTHWELFRPEAEAGAEPPALGQSTSQA